MPASAIAFEIGPVEAGKDPYVSVLEGQLLLRTSYEPVSHSILRQASNGTQMIGQIEDSRILGFGLSS